MFDPTWNGTCFGRIVVIPTLNYLLSTRAGLRCLDSSHYCRQTLVEALIQLDLIRAIESGKNLLEMVARYPPSRFGGTIERCGVIAIGDLPHSRLCNHRSRRQSVDSNSDRDETCFVD